MNNLRLNGCADFETDSVLAGPIIGGVRTCIARDQGAGWRNTGMNQQASRNAHMVARGLQSLLQDTIWHHPDQMNCSGVIAKTEEDKR